MTELPEPTFDSDGDPTDDYLKAIATADNKDVIKLAEAAWRMDYGAISREKTEDDVLVRCNLVRFVTGGWSANEMIIAAMEENAIFMAIKWESSHRGGLHRFHE